MNRFPLAFLVFAAMAILSGCDTVLQQRIVRAQVSMPEPPVLPILPLDREERLVARLGLGQRITGLPRTGVLDDSSQNRLQLDIPSTGADLSLFFHYKVLFTGVEISGRQTTAMIGTNIQADGWQFLAWMGSGFVSYSENVLYKQRVGSFYNNDTTWRLSIDSEQTASIRFSAGLSALFGEGAIRPFAAASIFAGPSIDGSSSFWGSDVPAASNKFSLTQIVLDGGLRFDFTPRIHSFAGVGWRTFLDPEIPGHDWRFYAGASIDWVRSDAPESERRSLERRANIPKPIPIRPDSLESPKPDSTHRDIAPATVHFQDVQ